MHVIACAKWKDTERTHAKTAPPTSERDKTFPSLSSIVTCFSQRCGTIELVCLT